MTFSSLVDAPLTKSSVAVVFATASAWRASTRNASSWPRLLSSRSRGAAGLACLPARSSNTFLMARDPVPGRHLDRNPRPQLRRQREHFVFRASQHDAVQLDRQLLDVRRAARLPAVFAFFGGTVPLGEGEKAAAERVSGQLQQHEEIAGAAGERRSGQQLHGKRLAPPWRRWPSAGARACCARWCGSSGSAPRRIPAPPTARARGRRCAVRGCRS